MRNNYVWPCFKTKDMAQNNAYQSALNKFKMKCKGAEPPHERIESCGIGCHCGLTSGIKVTMANSDFSVLVKSYACICENCGED
jgi:hypothetical protein